MSSLYLGVAGDALSSKEDSLSSVTKLGGRPTFPVEVLEAPNHAEILSTFSTAMMCGRCGRPMHLIAQAFSPLLQAGPIGDHTRMVYIAGCNSESCSKAAPPAATASGSGEGGNGAAAFCAVAVQIDKLDSEAEKDDEDEEEEEEESEEEQGTTQQQQRNSKCVVQLSAPKAFPAIAIDIEEAEDDGDDDDDDESDSDSDDVKRKEKLEAELKKAEEINAEFSLNKQARNNDADDDGDDNDKSGSGSRNPKAAVAGDDVAAELNDLESKLDLKDKKIDGMFTYFSKQLEKCPRQVLRYHPGGKPLFQNPDVFSGFFPSSSSSVTSFSSSSSSSSSSSPFMCTSCGKPLRMEMQVLPTAIYFLNCSKFANQSQEDNAHHHHSSTNNDGMDFGTLTVFSCSAECSATKKGCILQRLFMLVEPPPSLRDDQMAAQREGKTTMRDLVKDEKNKQQHP